MRTQSRSPRRRQARPSRRAAARLRRRRRGPDRAGPGAGAADARRRLPCTERALSLRGQPLRLPVVRHLAPRSGGRGSRRARRRALRRELPRRHPGAIRARREQDRAGRLLPGHDDGAACRAAADEAARRHRRLLRHAGRAGVAGRRDQVAPSRGAAARRQRRDAAAPAHRARRRGAAPERRDGAHAYRPGRRPRHRRDRPRARRPFPARCLQAPGSPSEKSA